MKTHYFIFSRLLVLNIIVLFLTFSQIQFAIIGINEIFRTGVNDFFDSYFIGVIFYILFLSIYIWLLTSTFLPIIKIDDFQIKAYSVFWTRTIKFDEIQSVKLLKATFYWSGRYSGTSFGLTFTKTPEKSSVFGLRKQTFIVLSKNGIKIPTSKSRQLFSHQDLVSKDAIGFEYSPEAFAIIQNKLKIQVI